MTTKPMSMLLMMLVRAFVYLTLLLRLRRRQNLRNLVDIVYSVDYRGI